MNDVPDTAANWLRLAMPYNGHGATIETWFLELSGDGGVLRQVGLNSEGAAVYRCGSDDFGVWNNEMFTLDRYSSTNVMWADLIERYSGTVCEEADFQSHWDRGTSKPGSWPNETMSARFLAHLRGMLPK